MPHLEALIGTVEILKKGTIEIRTYNSFTIDTLGGSALYISVRKKGCLNFKFPIQLFCRRAAWKESRTSETSRRSRKPDCESAQSSSSTCSATGAVSKSARE